MDSCSQEEPTEPLMSGVHGLAWRPTGPHAVQRILAWAGFEHTHVVRWVTGKKRLGGRLGMVAARRPELLAPPRFGLSRMSGPRARSSAG